MEATAHLSSLQDPGPWSGGVRLSVVKSAGSWDETTHQVDCAPIGFAGVAGAQAAEVVSGQERLAALVRGADRLRASVVVEAGGFDFVEAADFADRVEELSRTAEFLQIVAASAVERTRREAVLAAARIASPPAWRTGWTEPEASDISEADSAGTAATAQPGAAGSVAASVALSVVDDGFRNAGEFLRSRLRIGIVEARRRLSLADVVLPQVGIAGQAVPARHGTLAAAVAAAAVPSRSATVVSLALDRVRHTADAPALEAMERALTRTAEESDPEFLSRIARRWVDAIDQDGSEPSEEELRQRQGVFLRRPRRGLQHLEIFATPEQFETLATAMNPATNPRHRPAGAEDPSSSGDGSEGAGTGAAASGASTDAAEPETDAAPGGGAVLDGRTRAQKLLDGLVGACSLALATGKLPATGGLRPQVMVTIDYKELYGRLTATIGGARVPNSSVALRTHTQPGGTAQSGGTAQTAQPGGTAQTAQPGGTALFTGPITASTVRKIACDADIIPVLLGGQGRILNIGRASRVFPPHIRKAITARDQGCAFPGCTIPAPWCEAHHITYWSRGGETSTENGALLCSHHHHLIHKEQWQIQPRAGVPWFIPPPHIDPRQTPRKNYYFTPTRT